MLAKTFYQKLEEHRQKSHQEGQKKGKGLEVEICLPI